MAGNKARQEGATRDSGGTVRLVVLVIAGLWLFAVGLQGLAFLVKYGMLPWLPAWVARIDFTPQYTLLAVLVVVGTIVARIKVISVMATEDEVREIRHRLEEKRGKRR